ncbi:Phosphohistidine phosphatase SixA [Pirellulimonas nuda]|uniref:Phosphohistidine phosphatase SixA n=1 Tax=Pirellulimonas nuda TaxID=2528009 RepID=A0A518D7D7_9BACT|nr:histidine phosphatase family protein [Pirellulimonas nuda]QDU87365.1 Phosphohistidine phosphatase SixA [Pirellulimonas nuda]
MKLYIARHAWAGSYGDPAWPDDSERPLEPGGAERYAKLVARLAERGMAPERVASSPLVRCVQTAEVLADQTQHRPEIERLDALAPGVELDSLLEWTGRSQADAAWVGHNPDVEHLVALLIGQSGAVRFAKGAIASLLFEGPVRPGAGVLQWHVTAKVLGV